MSEDPETPADTAGQEPDEPIVALAELEQDISPTFLAVVRKKIYRRTAASQVASFSWNIPRMIFFELANIFTRLLMLAGKRGGRSL
jgi:hypothetical protein